MPTKVYFEITGEVRLIEEDSYYTEDRLLERLQYTDISAEIVRDILKKFGKVQNERNSSRKFNKSYNDYEIKDALVDLTFSKGSIITTGIAIINIAGQIAGALSFIEYIGKAIKYIIERRIREQFSDIIPSINVQTKDVKETDFSTSQGSDSLLLKKITPVQVLSYLAFINAVLILGGTIFGSFQIKSIQDKFEESSQILNETKLHYYEKGDSLQQSLNSAHANLISQISRIGLDLNTQDSLKNIKVFELKQSLYQIETREKDLNKSIREKSVQLENINTSLNNLQSKKPQFDLSDVWNYSGKSILIFIALILALAIIALRRTFPLR